jgi:iron complex outermembrane receptor protein
LTGEHFIELAAGPVVGNSLQSHDWCEIPGLNRPLPKVSQADCLGDDRRRRKQRQGQNGFTETNAPDTSALQGWHVSRSDCRSRPTIPTPRSPFMFKTTKLCKALMLAFGGGMLATGALAQRVEITGSSIRQISSESALPVTVLKTEELAKAGVTNAEQALAFITSNQSVTNSAASVGASNGGASYADLRGLGAGRTLVLLNGKRMVNNPYDAGTTAVDLNTIPYGAVDRIEVLNDGASAIYGSDAVAGVVNFITRREFQGLTLEGSLSQPTSSGGGQAYDVGVTGGIGSLTEEGWNLFGSISFRGQASLRATDRSFSNTAYRPDKGIDYTSAISSPANYYQDPLPDLFNPALPNCDPPTSYPSYGYCGFNYVRYTDTVPQQYQLNIYAKGSYAVNNDNTVSLEYLQGNNKLTTRVAPTPLIALPMASTNPFFPGGPGAGGVPGTAANTDPGFDPNSPIGLYWRTTQLGSRTDVFDTKTDRFLLDWQGSHKGWDYSVAALSSNANNKHYFDGGYVNSSGMEAGLNGTPVKPGDPIPPWLNPFGSQTAAGQAYMNNQLILGQVQQSKGTLWGVKADASSEIYKLPAGPLTMGLGVEYYRDKVEYTNNFALIREAASSGLENTNDASGSRSWTGLFVEFNIPVVKEFDVSLALRYDNYSDFGSTTNPKAAFRWTPSKDLLVRGSINSGFRAPSLFEVNAPPSTTNTASQFDDPVLCPGGVVNVAAGGNALRDCDTQFDRQQSGNKNLNPETSTAWSLGLVFQPTPASTVSVDYWNYNISDSIGTVGEEAIFGDSTKYASNFVRCSQLSPDQASALPQCNNPGSADPLAYIKDQYVNLGNYKTSGLDFSAAWRSEVTEYGRFSVGWQATYVLQYEYQLESGGVYNNNLGTYFNGNPISRYRQVLNLGWQQGPWLVNLINRYSRGYTDQNLDVAPEFYNTVGSVNTWDLAATWTGMKNLSVTAGLTNLFNQDPPFSNSSNGTQVGFDYRYANPIGRAFLLRAVYTF